MNPLVLYISLILAILMIVGAFVVVVTKDLLVAIVASAVVDLVLAIMFYILRAPDVAITQATIGAGLTIAIFLIALRKTERYEE